MPEESEKHFIRKVLITVGIVTTVFALILVLRFGIHVILILFASILLAILWRGVAKWISRKINISPNVATPLVILFHLGISALVIWLLYPNISDQVTVLSEQIPQIAKELTEKFRNSNFGQTLLSQLPQNQQWLQNPGQAFSQVLNIFSVTLNVFLDIVFILALAIFFSTNPGLYVNGFVKLFPLSKRKRTREVLSELDNTLFRWFIAKIVDMFSIFVMTSIGLWILDIPLVLTLALIAFLFSFIPNIGPILSAIPALLIAFVQEPIMALYVGLLYLGIQLVESYFVTPKVQEKAIFMPPVLLLAIQLFFAAIVGVLGLFLATPVLAMVMIVIKMLYIEDTLGDKKSA